MHWSGSLQIWKGFAVGLTCGLAVATRFNNGVFLLLVAAFALKTIWKNKPPAIQTRYVLFAVATGVGLIVGFSPQAIAWKVLHGHFLSGPQDAGTDLARTFTLWTSPNAVKILFSTRHGLFIWTPVLLAALGGWVWLAVRKHWLDRWLLLMFLAQLWVIGSWGMWWGGASFGQRFFLNHSAGFAFGLAWFWVCTKTRWQRWVLTGYLIVSLLWSTGLAVQYGAAIISREEAVPLRRMAANQFTRVPEFLLSKTGIFATEDIDSESDAK
jgi:hypothetical protein